MTDENTTDVATANDVRAWGRDNGYEVKDTGRLSGDLKKAFTDATGRATA